MALPALVALAAVLFGSLEVLGPAALYLAGALFVTGCVAVPLAALSRRVNKNLTTRLQYGYYYYDEPTLASANNLAMLLVQSGGNLDVALNHAQTAVKAMPNNPNITDTLGLIYLNKGLASLAVPAFETSTKARPGDPEFWLHLGQAYVGTGDKVKAREALQRALKVNPQFGGAAIAVKALEDLNKRA
jgi:predicted Zn-dependent protease